MIQKKKLPGKHPSSLKRKINRQSSTESLKEKTEKGKSTYFQKKERLDKSYAKMVQDLKTAIAESVAKDVEVDVVKRRRRGYWRDHGGLTKTEFNNLWSKCEVEIEDVERKAVNMKSRKKAGKMKRQRSFQKDQVLDSKKNAIKSKRKRQENRWIHLFAPHYQENLITDFNDDKLYKKTYISEAEMEDDERL